MISVWDLKKFKLLVLIKDEEVHNSEIRAAKFYSTQEENSLGIISVESNGPVRNIEVEKNAAFFNITGKPYKVSKIYNKRLKNPTSIAV